MFLGKKCFFADMLPIKNNLGRNWILFITFLLSNCASKIDRQYANI